MNDVAPESDNDNAVLSVTYFNNIRTVVGRRVALTWGELFGAFTQDVFPFRGLEHHPGWSPTTFADDTRSKAKVEEAYVLCLDFDEGSDADMAVPFEVFPGIELMVHPTKKSTPAAPRFRALLLLSRPVTADEYELLWRVVNRRVEVAGCKVDPQTKDAGRFWFQPSLPAEGAFFVRRQRGAPLDVDALLGEWVEDDVPESVGRPTTAAHPAAMTGAANTILGKAFAEMGWVRRALANGALAVRCPNEAGHTSGDPDDPNDTSTVIFPSTSRNGLGGFHCSHAHCEGLTSREVLKLVDPQVLARAGWKVHRGEDGDPGEGGGRQPSVAVLLVELASERCEFFHSPEESVAYAVLEPEGSRQVVPVRSPQFRSFLGRLAHHELKKVPSGSAMSDAVNVLEAKALYDGEARPVHVRIAAHGDDIYIDLADGRAAVRVTPTGWEITESPPVDFFRPEGMQPLPVPERGGAVDELKTFFNVEDEATFRLLVAVLLSWFCPRGPYIVLVITGEQGCAKTTTARMLKSLIDPGRAGLRALSRDVRDLMIAARSVWVLGFDNLSNISAENSDALARLSTGGGFATRQLFTDVGQVIIDVVRPILINGIDESYGRADLQDRAITVVLPVISEDARRDETSLWREFEAARPRIFGALLDAVACALRRFEETTLLRKPRMADPARWVTAAEEALGWEPGTFVTLMFQAQRESARTGIEADLVASGIARLLRERPVWTGTSTLLLQQIAATTPDDARHARDFPKTPAQLGVRLRRAAPVLRRLLGIEMTTDRRGASGERVIELRRQPVGAVGAQATAAPPKRNGADDADGADTVLASYEPLDEHDTNEFERDVDEAADQQRLEAVLRLAGVVTARGVQ